MNLELLTALAAGVLLGVGVGWWRCMVYARKLRHFGINLDDWSHYDEYVAQAQRSEGPSPAPTPTTMPVCPETF